MKKRFSLLALVVALFTLVLFTACGGTPAATLNKTELSMTVGTEFTLEAALTNVQEVTWESSDHKTVDVTADGKTAVVKALKAGTVTISVMNGEDVLATCETTVAESPLSVFLPDGKLVLRINSSATVKAVCLTELNGEAVWSSSDEAIGTVEAQGMTARVTARKRGTCTITVKADGYAASFTLMVGIV